VNINQVEYKYIIINNNGHTKAWENGPNRILDVTNTYKKVAEDIWENRIESEQIDNSYYPGHDSQFGGLPTTFEVYKSNNILIKYLGI